jgi:hypothetical protein
MSCFLPTDYSYGKHAMFEIGSLPDWDNIAGITSGVLALGGALLGVKKFVKRAGAKAGSEATGAREEAASHSTSGNQSPVVANNTGNVNVSYNTTYHNHPPVESTPPKSEPECDIPGRWNRQRAIELCMQHLNAADWNGYDPDLELPLEHNVIDQYSLPYSNRGEGMVVLFYTKTEGHDYHACAPHVSIFEFEKVAKGWNLITEDIAVFRGGVWGEPPQASVQLISGERYAVIFRDGDMHQGWCVEASTILAKLGDTFTRLLFMITAQSDADGNGWSSELTFKDNGEALRDLEVRRKPDEGSTNFVFLDGREELKHMVADYHDNIRPYDLFKFNGISYTYSPAIN